MKKKFLLGLSICMCLGLAGCGEKGNASLKIDSSRAVATSIRAQSENEVKTMTTATTKETTENTVAAGNAASVQLSNNLYDFEISIDNNLIKLPISLKDMLAMGFTYNEDDSKMIPANRVAFAQVLQYGESSLYVDLINYDINEKSYEDCLVYSMKLSDYFMSKANLDIKLSKDIVPFKSTMDEVKAAYGEPTEVVEKTDFPRYKYCLDENRYVEFKFDVSKGNVLADIDIYNREKPEDFVPSEIDTSVPDIVKAYQAPAGLTDNLYDYVFEFAGDLYSCPMPISEMVKNGWTILDGAENNVLEGNGFGEVKISRDNETVNVLVQNYSSNATTISNCFVTIIKSSELGGDVDMKIANNIYKGMPVDEFEKALEGYSVEKDSTKHLDFYNVKDPNRSYHGYKFIVREGIVIEIRVNYSPEQAKLEEMYGIK